MSDRPNMGPCRCGGVEHIHIKHISDHDVMYPRVGAVDCGSCGHRVAFTFRFLDELQTKAAEAWNQSALIRTAEEHVEKLERENAALRNAFKLVAKLDLEAYDKWISNAARAEKAEAALVAFKAEAVRIVDKRRIGFADDDRALAEIIDEINSLPLPKSAERIAKVLEAAEHCLSVPNHYEHEFPTIWGNLLQAVRELEAEESK